MNDLFRSELRRFVRYGVVIAVAHLLLLVFISRTMNLLQTPYFDSAPILAVCMALGFALALVQVGSYRKPSQWLWLIHRPLPPGRIFAALASSAFTLLALAILLPQLVLVAVLDLFTAHVVDSRHYATPLHVLLFAAMAWLAGCHAVLSRSKAAIAVLAVPVVLALHLVSVWWLLLPVLACLAWLGYVALCGFRADRDAPLRSSLALVLTALPLQLGFFVLAAGVGQTAYVLGGMLVGTDPLNTQYPPEGGLIEIQRKEPADALILGLRASDDPRAASWIEQLPLLEPEGIGAWVQRFPIRHQLGNLAVSTQMFDEKRGVMWTFSHDRMLFHGRDPKSGADHGWWGTGGAGDTTPFTAVPILGLQQLMLTPSVLYAVDFDRGTQHEQLRLRDGETFVDVPRKALGRVFALTGERLLAYRPDRQATSKFAPPLPDWSLPLPAGAANLDGVQIAELMDGWLVSFLYGDGHRQIGFSQFSVIAEPRQHIVFVDDDGTATVVVERAIARDYPAMFRVPWWISPPLHMLSEWPESALDKGLTWPLRPERLPDAAEFYVAAIALMLVSLALAAWWLRDARITRARRAVWLATCGVISLPALFSLMCLEARVPRG